MNAKSRLICFVAAIMPICAALAIENQDQSRELPVVYSTDFESGAGDWKFIDKGWKVKQVGDPGAEGATKVLSQFKKKTDYKPKVRSPGHIALLKQTTVADFQLDVRVHSTHQDYNHRDACLFFGYQSPTQFYYVHLGKKTDDHANQIFIVNNAARTKISTKTTEGTPWDDKWHNVRITRNVETGQIKVFFDDMQTPVMTAIDKTFVSGQIGLGSFDDTTDWDDLSLKGRVVTIVREVD